MQIARAIITCRMNLLDGLNPQQQQAVLAGAGPVLVMAGPGSGKTRVLTHRVAHLVGSIGVRSQNILAVTFTNKAAREMEKRTNHLLGQFTRGMTIGTFHSICAHILRREASSLPFESNFIIYDADDQISLVKSTLKEFNLDEKRFRPASVQAAISMAKNELLLPDEYPIQNYRDETIQRIYKRYQQILLANNALDFDDLLLWTAILVAESSDVRQKYARRFEQILVDEFQDTNQAQYSLLKHLTSFHRNIFVVGDMDQSIYRWRGADYRNLLRFEQDFPDAQIILLEQNYRSTQSILDVAMEIINPHPHRVPKLLFTSRTGGTKVILHTAYDDRNEASFVADAILHSIAAHETSPGDFAVMYRTNAQSRLLEEAFLRNKLPYRLVGAQRFYGRREIKDIIAYLRVVFNPGDELSLLRIINVPRRGIGDKTLVILRLQAQQNRTQLGEYLLWLGQNREVINFKDFAGQTGNHLANFGLYLDRWLKLKNEITPLALIDQILQDVNYRSYIDDGTDEGHDRWENVVELRRLASEYNEKGLAAFLEQIALVSDQDTIIENSNVPTLLTLHASKGLEFPVVFIVGLVEGILPHSRSFDEPEEMLEERRLIYVGITRAMNKLFLTTFQIRSAFGYTEPVDPSRFIDDIPEKLIQYSGESYAHRQLESFIEKNIYSTQPVNNIAQKSPPNQKQYHPGMHVQHSTWGEGMVLNSRLDAGDEIVDIFFENLGLKRVSASLAKLDVITSK